MKKFKPFVAALLIAATVMAGNIVILALNIGSNAAAADRTIKIVVLGDTIIENKGVAAQDRFPEQLEFALRGKGLVVSVVNAGFVSDTAARTLRRSDRAITDDTDAVILVVGGNDMLQGISPDVVREVLGAIIHHVLWSSE